MRLVSILVFVLSIVGCQQKEDDSIVHGYFVLGCLDEYLGYSYVEGGDNVDYFYPGEEVAAAVFLEHLELFAEELDEDADIEIEMQGEYGTSGISVHSLVLKEAIVSMYPDWQLIGGNMEGQEIYQSFVTAEVIEIGGRDGKMEYLAGAYSRFFSGEEFRFANALHKAEIIRDLLVEFDCTDVDLVTIAGFPGTTTITFQPSEEIEELFARVDEELESAELADWIFDEYTLRPPPPIPLVEGEF